MGLKKPLTVGRGGVVAWWRAGVVACGRAGVVAWWRGGVVVWWRGGVFSKVVPKQTEVLNFALGVTLTPTPHT